MKSASAVGLRSFATQTTGIRSYSSPSHTVTIGFHYAADSNGDGLPDYWKALYGFDLDVEIPNPNDPNDPHAPAGDPNGDGISNWQHYLAGTHPLRPPSQNITSAGINYKRLTPSASLAATGKAYDVYHRPNVNAKWRRISSGIPGQKTFTFVNPNPSAEGDYIFLDAADDDGDGLSNGYENWFTYGGQRTMPHFDDSNGDLLRDGWKVAYGLNPMDATGVNAPGYRVIVGQQQDQYTSLEKQNLYYAAAAGYDASFDPLKLTGTADVRPVVTISPIAPNGFNLATFTISRDVGSGSLNNALVVHFALGGGLVYRRDYVLLAPQGSTLNDGFAPFSITIPAGQNSVDVTVVVTPGAVPVSNLIVTLVSYQSLQ